MDTNDILDKIGDLPSLPMVASRISAEMKNDSLTAKGLGKILSEDSSLTAKILRLSNSAFYGMQKQITSVDKAVVVLGFDTVKNLALSISIYSFFEKGDDSNINVTGLWHHSLGCAVSAKSVIEKSHRHLADEAFLFGIIHDIGKIILINTNLEDMENVIKVMFEKGSNLKDAEMEIFGFTHQRIGSMAVQKWNFPDKFASGIKLHNNLPPNTQRLDSDTAKLVNALCVGNQLTKVLNLGQSTNPERKVVPPEMWKDLGFKRDEMVQLKNNVKDSFNQILNAWT